MDRLYEEKYNNQGCLMKIVEYHSHNNIVVEFQDKYKLKVNTTYGNFKAGCVRNPYYPTVYGVGISGNKYPIIQNGQNTKEYNTWYQLLKRCFNNEFKEERPEYKDAMCCEEWLNYEKFYEWIHSQDNFYKWLNGHRWALDKDIIIKGNKLYSPETCCLVPQNVNCLLLKRDASRSDMPIGVRKAGNKFQAVCGNSLDGGADHLGSFETKEEAFYAYKHQREYYIKQVAEIEYNAGNITKACYNGLMNHVIEIDD